MERARDERELGSCHDNHAFPGRSTVMTCYRILVRDGSLRRRPILVAADHREMVQKVATLYPDGVLEAVRVLHGKHLRGGRVQAQESALSGFFIDSSRIERRRA